jgi:hypothetical protein
MLKEYLIPKDYDKPRIEIHNYFLKRDDDNKSYGIHPRSPFPCYVALPHILLLRLYSCRILSYSA